MKRRNVVVFLCDQLRPDFLEIYGCEGVPTPNINRLAKEGVVFDQAITQSPCCAPARACMMTGRYVSDHQVWTNDLPFRDGLEYLPQRMNELGYSTAAFGKLHHFPADDAKGFQHVRQMEEGRLGDGEPYLRWLQERHPDVNDIFAEGIPDRKEYEFPFGEEDYYEHWIASETIAFLQYHLASESSSPFFVWVSFQGPHGPADPPAEVKGTIESDALPRPIQRLETNIPEIHRYYEVTDGRGTADPNAIMAIREVYAEMIAAIDRQIGRILGALERFGMLKDTTFIFSADHGDMLGDHGLWAKGPFPYRGQLDIPLLVANHPLIPRGIRSDNLVGNIDIPATALEIAGAHSGIGVSRSLIDQAQEEPRRPREVNFSESGDSARIVEDARYRYCYYPFTDWSELYDKRNDPDEQVNLADRPEYASLALRFAKHIIDFDLIGRGVRMEAKYFVPGQQAGMEKKHPDYRRDVSVAFPLHSRHELEALEEAGLASDYNEFCKDKHVLADYGVYWKEETS